MEQWTQGIPIVINGVDIESYDPGYFIAIFGDKKVWVENCEDESCTKMGVDEYLADFGTCERGEMDPILKLKVCAQTLGGNLFHYHVNRTFRRKIILKSCSVISSMHLWILFRCRT